MATMRDIVDKIKEMMRKYHYLKSETYSKNETNTLLNNKADTSTLSTVATSGSYTDLLNKPSIPTKTSELINDSNFLTQHQSLLNYVQKSQTAGLIKNDGTIDTSIYQNIDAKANTVDLATVAISGDYDDLINKPDIPVVEAVKVTSNKGTASAATMNKIYIEVSGSKRDSYYTEENNGVYSWHKLDADVLDDLSIDWDDIENKPSIPTKTSDLTNDSNFLTQHQSLANYIEKSTTTGLVKNDGTIDTNDYASDIQMIDARIDAITIPEGTSDLTNDANFATTEAVNSKAPINHKSTETTYGIGTTTEYGHCKTINNLTTASHSDGNALSAYQGKILKDGIDSKANSVHNQASNTITDTNTYSDIGNTAQTQESINIAINNKLNALNITVIDDESEIVENGIYILDVERGA